MPTFSTEQRFAIAVGVPALALLLFLWYRRRQQDESFDDDDDEEEEQAVARAFETRIEVQIPKVLVGTVIGRGGAMIKQIQKESGAYLRFEDDEKESEEVVEFDEAKPAEKTRTVVIRGEREKARKAEFMIKKIISEKPKILTEEYFVPQRCCGRIIGRGGMTIRHLSKVSGAKITIDRDELRPDVPRKCTIVGSAEQIINAKGLLDEKVAEHEQAMARRNPTSRYRKNEPPVVNPNVTDLQTSAPSTVQFPNTNDFVEVFVSAINNPGHFYVQLVRTGEAQKLDQLIDVITDDTSSGSAEEFIESVEVGTICSAPFAHDDSRYRARVTQVNTDGIVGLFYVDYGDIGTVAKEKLRKLRKEYLQLPFQAIECFLANTKPRVENWDEQSLEDFKKLVRYPDWVGLMAKNVKYCGSIPCLDLYDTTTDHDINISQEMIKRGYALEDSSYPPQPTHPESTNNDDPDNLVRISEEKQVTETQLLAMDSATLDEEDANKDLNLSGPINPDEFSPIKSALVKRVSKDYIDTAKVPLPGKQPSDKTISEEKVVLEPAIDAQLESQFQTLSGAELLSEPKLDGKLAPGADSVLEVKSMPKIESEVASTAENDDNRSDVAEVSGFGSPNASQVLKPEVREMIEIEVGQAFQTQLTPPNGIVTNPWIEDRGDEGDAPNEQPQFDPWIEPRHDSKAEIMESTVNVSVDSHSQPSVMQVAVTSSSSNDNDSNDDDDDDDDDELETFTSTLQKQVQSKKTFVSSVMVTSSHTKRSTVTIVPRNDMEKVVSEKIVSQASKISFAQATMKLNGNDIVNRSELAKSSGDEENNTISERLQISSQPDKDTFFTVQQEVKSYNIGSLSSASFQQQTIFHMTHQNDDKTPIPNQQNGSLDTETKGLLNVDHKSPVDSDSESYLSALEEPASDTDTTSHYETAADRMSGSTTSLDYLTPEPDTDTDTVKTHGEENGTPVNTDSENDEYDSDDESETDIGDTTPKRKASIDHDDESTTPKAGDSLKMAGKYLSDMDIGYKGDSEDVSESREDLVDL